MSSLESLSNPDKLKLLYILNHNVKDIEYELHTLISNLEYYDCVTPVADDITNDATLFNAFENPSCGNIDGIILLVISSDDDNFCDKIETNIKSISSNPKLKDVPKLCIFIEKRGMINGPNKICMEIPESQIQNLIAYRMTVKDVKHAIKYLTPDYLSTGVKKKINMITLLDEFSENDGCSELLTNEQSKEFYLDPQKNNTKLCNIFRTNRYILPRIRQYLEDQTNSNLKQSQEIHIMNQILNKINISFNLHVKISTEDQKLIKNAVKSTETYETNYNQQGGKEYEVKYNRTLLVIEDHDIVNIAGNIKNLRYAFRQIGKTKSNPKKFLESEYIDRVIFIILRNKRLSPTEEFEYIDKYKQSQKNKPKLFFFIYEEITNDIVEADLMGLPKDCLIVRIIVKKVAVALFHMSDIIWMIRSKECILDILKKLERNIDGKLSEVGNTLKKKMFLQNYLSFLCDGQFDFYDEKFLKSKHVKMKKNHFNKDPEMLKKMWIFNLEDNYIKLIERPRNYKGINLKELKTLSKYQSLIEIKDFNMTTVDAMEYNDDAANTKLLYFINQDFNLSINNKARLEASFKNIGFTLYGNAISNVEELRRDVGREKFLYSNGIALVALAYEIKSNKDKHNYNKKEEDKERDREKEKAKGRKEHEFVKQFFANKAPGLAGFPKLFFFLYEKLKTPESDSDNVGNSIYTKYLPIQADCLIISINTDNIELVLDGISEALNKVGEKKFYALELINQLGNNEAVKKLTFQSTLTRRLYFKKRVMTSEDRENIRNNIRKRRLLEDIESLELDIGDPKVEQFYKKHNLGDIKNDIENDRLRASEMIKRAKVVNEFLYDL